MKNKGFDREIIRTPQNRHFLKYCCKIYFMHYTILDCYTDEASGLGVPPYWALIRDTSTDS